MPLRSLPQSGSRRPRRKIKTIQVLPTLITAGNLVISFSSDWRFNTARSREVVHALMKAGRNVSFAEIPTHFGHDSFLMPIDRYLRVFGAYMGSIST